MLTVPMDRITILLEQASEVETALEDNADESDAATLAETASDDLGKALADIPAYRELTATLDGLTPQEVCDLLAIAVIGDNVEDPSDTVLLWARSMAADDALSEVARILVLTDAIGNGLDRLGYKLPKDGAAEAAVEEEECKGEAELEA